MSFQEILDLVSPNDVVIGQEKRSLIYSKKLNNFRVINGFICNSENKLWIPRRHPGKKLFPLYLDASVGGHVSSGETYEKAFVRETQEELGIDILQYNYEKVARLTPHENGTSAFMYVYIIKSNETPKFNTNDFIDYEWLSFAQLIEKIRAGEKAKSDLPIILNVIKKNLTSLINTN